MRNLVVIATACLLFSQNFAFAATATNAADRPVTQEDLDRLAEQMRSTRMLREAGGGDAKLWKKYRDAGRKAEKDKNPTEAEQHYHAAAREADGFKERDKRRAESLADWGRVLYQNRKFRQALQVYQDLVSFHERDLGKHHTALVFPLVDLAKTAVQVDRIDIATNCYRRAQAIAETHQGRHSDMVGELLGLHGIALMEAGRINEAETMLLQAVQILQNPKSGVRLSADGTIRRDARPPSYVSIAGIYNSLALLNMKAGRAAEAEPYFRQSLTVYERELGKTSEGVAMAAHNLGLFYLGQRRADEAQPLVERGLNIREKLLGPNHQIVADSLQALAEVYREQGKTIEAAKLEARTLEIRRRTSGRR